MRDFKNPTYDGPDCVCCKAKAAEERERIIKLLEENAKDISDAYASGLFLVATKSLIALIKEDSNGTK